jgi:GNAT superfamily N-acetyltransferase
MARIVRLFASIPATLKDLGLLNALLYWADRLSDACSGGKFRVRRYLFVVQALQSSPGGRAGGGTLAIRPLLAEDIGAIRFPVADQEIRRRLAQGSMCLLAEITGQFAGYIWLHVGAYPEDEVRCHFEPWPAERVCWDFDVYVEPRFRATRTFLRLWQAAAQHLQPRGFTHSASRISSSNAASLRAHLRSGAVICGSATFVTLGGKQVVIAPRGTPKSLYVSNDSVPQLRVSLPEASG